MPGGLDNINEVPLFLIFVKKKELSSITEVCRVSYLLLLTRTPY